MCWRAHTSRLGVVSGTLAEANADTANHKEKTLAEIDLSTFAGDLKPVMVDSADGPETGMLFTRDCPKWFADLYPSKEKLPAKAARARREEKLAARKKEKEAVAKAAERKDEFDWGTGAR